MGCYFWYSLTKTCSSWPLANGRNLNFTMKWDSDVATVRDPQFKLSSLPTPYTLSTQQKSSCFDRLATTNSSAWVFVISQARKLPKVIPTTAAAWMPGTKEKWWTCTNSHNKKLVISRAPHQRAKSQGRNSWYVTSTDLQHPEKPLSSGSLYPFHLETKRRSYLISIRKRKALLSSDKKL